MKNIKNWLWFIFVLRCDEFSRKLDLNPYKAIDSKLSIEDYHNDLMKKRQIAHELDEKMTDFKKKFKKKLDYLNPHT